MNRNKLNELDVVLYKFAEQNMLQYSIQTNNIITNNDLYAEVNINSIISKIVKGDHIKAISKNINNKNIFGYLIDCIVIDKNEYNIVICIPAKSKKYITLSSNNYEFYFKHRISKNKLKRNMFLSVLNN